MLNSKKYIKFNQVTVYFPGNELWYDIWTGEKLDVHGEVNVAAPYDKIPVYQKGGTIIPRLTSSNLL